MSRAVFPVQTSPRPLPENIQPPAAVFATTAAAAAEMSDDIVKPVYFGRDFGSKTNNRLLSSKEV